MDLLATHVAVLIERTRTEAALRLSEERFHSLYNNMAEGVALHSLVRDETGKPIDYLILEVNPAFERHTGLRSQEVAGKTATQAYGSTPYLDQYVQATTSGQQLQFETYFAPLDKTFSISVASPAPDQFATIFRDISEQVRLEAALRHASARFKAIIDASPVPMALSDGDGNVTYLNDAFVGMLGYTLDDLPTVTDWWPQGLSRSRLPGPSPKGMARSYRSGQNAR